MSSLLPTFSWQGLESLFLEFFLVLIVHLLFVKVFHLWKNNTSMSSIFWQGATSGSEDLAIPSEV